MAVPITVPDFLQSVRDSGLIDPTALAHHLDHLRHHDAIPSQPRKLANHLVRDGLLSQFQAEQLLLGHWHALTIGKYTILDQLGSGSSGVVYLVEQTAIGRKVAVKVLPLSGDLCPSLIQRFRLEARALALLDSPNIVHVHDFDQDGDKLFLVMEYVEGVTMQEWIKKIGRLDPLHACHYIRQAARGLQAIHEAGLVHRDIKPGNIMIDNQGVVKILDLGLARFLGEEGDSPTMKYESRRVLGTADFLSPEQAINSHDVDIRADIYSLGATFYFLLTGQTPFPTGTIVQKMVWVQSQEPRPVHEVQPEVSPDLTQVVARMMAKAPADRYPTPFEIVKALARWTTTPIKPPQLEPRLLHPQRLPGSSHLGVNSEAVRSTLDLPPMRPPHEDADPTPLPGASSADLSLALRTESSAELPQWPANAMEEQDTRVELGVTSAEPDSLLQWEPVDPLPKATAVPSAISAPALPLEEPEGRLWSQIFIIVAALLLSIGIGIALALAI